MNKFYMNGKLIHKASDHNTKRCEVEKWVFLPHSDFERLKANPYQEHEAITAARDLMYEDKNAYHCIMLLDEYGEDGLLIEAEGFDYPRLSMFVPDAKSIYDRYQTSEPELKLHDMIKDTVEKIAELAHTDKTDFTSADMIDMDEVESLIKNAIVQQLAMRNDIKMAKNTDIGVDFQPDIHVEAEKLTELKFYCPLKVQREIQPTFDKDEDEFFEDTERAFAIIAKEKYHVSFEAETPEKQPDSLTFHFGKDKGDEWVSESDIVHDFALAHPDCSFALGNAVLEYLDEKQHSERNIHFYPFNQGNRRGGSPLYHKRR